MDIYLFDIDGTLLLSGGAGKAALEEGLAEEFGVRDALAQLSLSGRTDTAIVRDTLRLAGLDVTPENHRRVLTAYLRRLPDCLRRLQGAVLPGVAELLARLARRSNARLGLLTGNIREGARVKLGHFGLADYFVAGGYGDLHHDRDDVAREALTAMEAHVGGALTLDRVWVIGDTPLDVRCARAIGARAVAVATGWHDRAELAACQPDVLLDDLREAAFVGEG